MAAMLCLAVSHANAKGLQPKHANQKHAQAITNAYTAYAHGVATKAPDSVQAKHLKELNKKCDDHCTGRGFRASCDGDQGMIELCAKSCPEAKVKNCIAKSKTANTKQAPYLTMNGLKLDVNHVPINAKVVNELQKGAKKHIQATRQHTKAAAVKQKQKKTEMKSERVSSRIVEDNEDADDQGGDDQGGDDQNADDQGDDDQGDDDSGDDDSGDDE